MTLQEVVDSFEVMLKLEFIKRKVTPIAVSKKMEALWLSQGIKDVARKTKEGENYQDITLVTDTYEYALAADFGSLIMVEIAGADKLEIVSLEQLQQRTQDQNAHQSATDPSYDPTTGITATSAAVYFKGATNPQPYIRFDGVPLVNPRVWYYKSWYLYSPAGTPANNFGTFDGFSFTGNFVLTDDFVPAVHEYMLSKIFDDRLGMYDRLIRELKQDRRITVADSLEYRMGDIQ